MCGFIGSAIVGHGRPSAIPIGASARIRWRGPDAYQEHVESDHCLGSARLAVIDLAPEANQPLVSANGSWELVFNGEIYNYRELANQYGLSDLARRSDAWALLELIGLKGVTEARRQIRGMYAFAAWEKAKSRLWLVRDPFGIKPLTWCRSGSEIMFASDPRALAIWRRSVGLSVDIDAYSLTHFLMVGYIPGDATAWTGIDRVAPGAVVAIDPQGVIVDVWDPLVGDDHIREVCVDSLEEAIRLSVARHLVADVEIGSFLSGGIDSSLITAIARRQFDAPMRTYSVGFDSDSVPDEAGAARATAKDLNTHHVEVKVGVDDFRELAESVSLAFPEPHADPAAMPMIALSRRARQDVKVVLTGEGGDEMFGGYRRHWALPLARSAAIRAAASMGLASLARRVGMRRPLQFAESAVGGSGAGFLRYLTQIHWDHVVRVSPLCSVDLVAQVVQRYAPHDRERFTPASLRQLELRRHLPETYLEKCDRTTMRHGLEARVPFLDLDLASLALSVPSHDLARLGRTKVLLRKVASRNLPASVAKAPKRGFEVPLASWVATPHASTWIQESLLDGEGLNTGIFDAAALSKVVQAPNRSGVAGAAEVLYRLLNLELWCRSAKAQGAL